MPNKKINQLDTRVNAALTDYLVVADPSTGYAYKELGSTFVDLAKTTLVPYTGATASVNLGEYGLTAGQLTLDTSPTGTAVVGTTRWNDTIGSSETLLKGGNVLLKNGVDLVARVVNKVTPSTTLTKASYKAVRVSGAQGQRLAIAYAQANNDNNSADTIGLVCETIAQNQEGFIITVGQLLDVNTTGSLQGETWADGDVLYLSPTTAGNLTNIKPTGATGHIVVIGYVEYAHAVHGSIYVKVMNGWELDELHNVYISSVANNDVLVYESSTTLWKNKSIATILGYTPADDSLVMKLAGSQTATGYKTFSIGLQTTTGDNYLNYTSGATYIGYSAAPVGSYKFAVSGDVLLNSTLKIQSNVAGGNTFLTIANQAGTSIATLTNGGALQFSGTATFSNTIGFNGKIGGSSTGGIAIVPGGVPSSLNTSQIYLLVSAPLGDYTSTYGLDQAGIYLGGTYNGGQGPQNMVLGPARYYNSGGTASNKWNFTVSPASGQVSDGFGSDLILTGGIGRGTGTPGKFIVQTSTATTTGTTLQTLSNRLEIDGTGQLKLNGYTSTSVFTGTVAGLLGFDSSGNVITTSASGGGISGSGTAGQVTYWTGTSAVGGSSNLFWDATKNNLGIGSTLVDTTFKLGVQGTIATTGFVNFQGANGLNNNTGLAYFGLDTNSFDMYTANSRSIKFFIGNERMRLFTSTGNLMLQNGGTFTDSGYRLDVNGTGASTGALRVTGGSTLIVGGGNTSATNALVVQNSSATNLLTIANNGVMSTSSITSYFSASILNAPDNYFGGGNTTLTSGYTYVFWANRRFLPTSGNATFSAFYIDSTINQTGGANGITRGLYVNPTLTAAADFRAIETTAGNVLFGSNFFWDNTNSRLGIGTNTPQKELHIYTAGTNEGAGFRVTPSQSGGVAAIQFSNTSNVFRGSLGYWDTGNGVFPNRLVLYAPSQTASFTIYTGSTSHTFDTATGNVALGSASHLGTRLGVVGDTLLRGSGNDSSTFALTVQNNSQVNTFRVRNDGYLLIGQASTSAAPAIYAFEGTTGLRSLRIGIQSAGSLTPIPAFNINQENNFTYTSGTGEFTTITANFLPTSGTGTLASLVLRSTINQTGGANGITRGLYVNPTLTAAADFRAIETTNGKIVFGNLPTSSAGLPTGAIWNNLGVINIV